MSLPVYSSLTDGTAASVPRANEPLTLLFHHSVSLSLSHSLSLFLPSALPLSRSLTLALSLTLPLSPFRSLSISLSSLSHSFALSLTLARSLARSLWPFCITVDIELSSTLNGAHTVTDGRINGPDGRMRHVTLTAVFIGGENECQQYLGKRGTAEGKG